MDWELIIMLSVIVIGIVFFLRWYYGSLSKMKYLFVIIGWLISLYVLFVILMLTDNDFVRKTLGIDAFVVGVIIGLYGVIRGK